MGRYAQFVIGSAGVGKSTYCQAIQQHLAEQQYKNRHVHIINLDPAADHFDYKPSFDIRDLISVDEVMQAYAYGPNGALMYCMEFLTRNLDWLHEQIDDYQDDYLIFDCPGQIEIFTSHDYMNVLTNELDRIGYRVCGVFCMDSLFTLDLKKFVSGSMICLSAMVRLGIPNISVLTKCDLIQDKQRLDKILDSDALDVVMDMEQEEKRKLVAKKDTTENNTTEDDKEPKMDRFSQLTRSIGTILSDYSLVNFITLDLNDEDSLERVVQLVDQTLQYGEDEEVDDKQHLKYQEAMMGMDSEAMEGAF